MTRAADSLLGPFILGSHLDRLETGAGRGEAASDVSQLE